jgi:hypothetical protein
MKKWLILFAGVAAMTTFSPAKSFAQGIGIGIDVPGVGVRIGEPYRHYRDWDGPRVYHEPRYRERDVYLRGSNCRTVTIQSDDGVTKRIRRCD